MPAEAGQQYNLAGLEAALPALRNELHRYCARMTGSVIDGEDVLQEALLRASSAILGGATVENHRAWLFRIAHNTALNFLRSQQNERIMRDNIRHSSVTFNQIPRHGEVSDNLRPFMNLTPKQRSTVILRDILGYTAAEVAELTDSSVPSVKSALRRGRVQLKCYSKDTSAVPVPLPQAEREVLAHYARCFNAHEFDRLRDMLSEEVRLELVGKDSRRGRAGVGNYYSNYQDREDWVMVPGCIEGRPATLVFDRDDLSGPPSYFVLLEFDGGNLLSIRDFRYARYAMADAQWQRF